MTPWSFKRQVLIWLELFQKFGIWNIAEQTDCKNSGVRAMATQIIMDRTGDTRHYFDAKDPQALLKAEERFKELTLVGFTAAVRTSSGEAALTRRFDPTAEETLFFPRLVGG